MTHEEMVAIVREIVEKEAKFEIYGFFPGGDPRKFVLDPDSNDEAQVEKHKQACAEWDKAEASGLPYPESKPGSRQDGGCFIDGGALGVYEFTDPQIVEALELFDGMLKRCREMGIL